MSTKPTEDRSEIMSATATVTGNEVNMAAIEACINKAIDMHTSTICGKIDKLNSDLTRMTNRVTDIEKAVESQQNEIKDTYDRMSNIEQKLREELAESKKQNLIQECYSRKSNLLFYGISQPANEDVEEVLREFFINQLKMVRNEAANILFVNVHRLPRMPRQNRNSPQGPVPIIAKFVSMKARNAVLDTARNKSKELREKKQIVCTDLPPILKRKRAFLLSKAYELRKEHKYLTRVTEKETAIQLQYRKGKEEVWRMWEQSS